MGTTLNLDEPWRIAELLEEMPSLVVPFITVFKENQQCYGSRIPQVSTLITSTGIPNSSSQWIKLKTADEMGKINLPPASTIRDSEPGKQLGAIGAQKPICCANEIHPVS